MPADQTTPTPEIAYTGSDDGGGQAPTRPSRLGRVLIRVSVAWLIVALIFWAWYLAAVAFVPQFLYSFVWLGLVGLPIWRWRRPLGRLVQVWRFPGFLKFMALGVVGQAKSG
jgi:hypothetical protein